MRYNAINRKLNGATYCVRMTNNGVTVNIACLRYSYTIDLLQRYKLAFFASVVH